MPQLDFSTFLPQVVWLLIAFALLYVVLANVFLPPLMRVIATRESTREADLASARAFKEEAETIKASYEQAMKTAQANAQALFAEVEKKNKEALERSLAEFTRSANQEYARAEHRIELQKQQVMAELAPALQSLVAQAVEKITDTAPDAASVQAAIGETLKGAA